MDQIAYIDKRSKMEQRKSNITIDSKEQTEHIEQMAYLGQIEHIEQIAYIEQMKQRETK